MIIFFTSLDILHGMPTGEAAQVGYIFHFPSREPLNERDSLNCGIIPIRSAVSQIYHNVRHAVQCMSIHLLFVSQQGE